MPTPSGPRAPNLEIDEVYGSRALPPHHVCNEALRPGDIVLLDGQPATLEKVTVSRPIDGQPIWVEGRVMTREDLPGGEISASLPGGKLTLLLARTEPVTGHWWVSWYSRLEPPQRSRLARALEGLFRGLDKNGQPVHALDGWAYLFNVPVGALLAWETDRALPKPGVLAMLIDIWQTLDLPAAPVAALTALLDRPLAEVTPFADLTGVATLREYAARTVIWLVEHTAGWEMHRRLAALQDGSLLPVNGLDDPSTPFLYWCTGSTMHDPSWGTYCGTIQAPTRAEAFEIVRTFIPDALHRFSRPCEPGEPTSDRFPKPAP